MIAWVRRFGWAAPWLLFLWFPVEDLLSVSRPGWAVTLGAVGLLGFVAGYMLSWSGPLSDISQQPRLIADHWQETGVYVTAGLSMLLAPAFGMNWCGLCIYVGVAAALVLPNGRAWCVTGASCAVSVAVLLAGGAAGFSLLFLPGIAVLTSFAMRGTRYLILVNEQLREAREELARTAVVVEERLRFARDLHDLLGHSLSLIVLKSELARRLGERDPQAALREVADVETVARHALTEVREAVGGYRQVSVAQALAEARSVLTGAGITAHLPTPAEPLPPDVDAALGWVVREATTNVLRHSAATRVTVGLTVSAGEVRLLVDDDGCGPAGTGTSGSGLTGLGERVAALGGQLTGGPAPGGGFRLAVRVPLGDPERVPVRTPAGVGER